MMKYYIEIEHLDVGGFVILESTVEAGTKAKAVYKAFKQYAEAFRLNGGLSSFVWFLKYALLKVTRLE